MPGLFWNPHSAQTLAALVAAPALAAAAAAKAVPHARQNWASSLFSVPHTEQSLVIRPASAPSCMVERRYLGLSAVAIWTDPLAMDNAPIFPSQRLFAVLYAFLKSVHLLAVVVWIGGMAFMLFCLRPAARVLEPPARVTLMHAAMKRFLAVAAIAVAVLFACGAAMVGMAWSAAARAGLGFNMPLDWYTMIATFFVMLA